MNKNILNVTKKIIGLLWLGGYNNLGRWQGFRKLFKETCQSWQIWQLNGNEKLNGLKRTYNRKISHQLFWFWSQPWSLWRLNGISLPSLDSLMWVWSLMEFLFHTDMSKMKICRNNTFNWIQKYRTTFLSLFTFVYFWIFPTKR